MAAKKKEEKAKPVKQNDGMFKPGNNANPDGRPTEWNIDLQNRIAAHVAAGHFFGDACTLVRIRPDLGRQWMLRGGKGEKPYDQFYDAVEAANASFKGGALGYIMAAVESDPKNYQAIFKLMALKFPKEWRETKDVELSGKEGGPIEVTISSIDAAMKACEDNESDDE